MTAASEITPEEPQTRTDEEMAILTTAPDAADLVDAPRPGGEVY